MFNDVFWISFITIMTGFSLKVISMAYKSKCKEISCGCIKVIRDTETEEKEFEFDRTHPSLTLQPSTNNLNNI